jgi:ribose 5-phosphate isomerase B
MISEETAREILAVWLETQFAGGRHQNRINKIRAIESRHLKPRSE